MVNAKSVAYNGTLTADFVRHASAEERKLAAGTKQVSVYARRRYKRVYSFCDYVLNRRL